MVRYQCIGSVRGWCGVTHRTIRAAERCCESDMRGCGRQGGYSDRRPVATGPTPIVSRGARYDIGLDAASDLSDGGFCACLECVERYGDAYTESARRLSAASGAEIDVWAVTYGSPDDYETGTDVKVWQKLHDMTAWGGH